MKSFTIIFMVMFALLVSWGCVQMRDYTGVRQGAFGLDVKKGFGEGGQKKDYYVVEGREAIVIGDTKDEVTAHLGFPDKITTTLEGYESWLYEKRELELLFENDKLREWRQF